MAGYGFGPLACTEGMDGPFNILVAVIAMLTLAAASVITFNLNNLQRMPLL